MAQYVVWPGPRNPPYNRFFEFDLPTALRIAEAIGKHRTQTVPIINGPWGINNSYAMMSLQPKSGRRFGEDVNRPDVTFFEGFVLHEGAQTVTSLV